MNDPATALVWLIVFLFSVTAHEAAHGLAAWLGGDPTAYAGGQVSLNPLPHIRREPFGMAILPVLSAFYQGWPIGWASTPYDPAWAERHPRRAAWMAAAGPGANLALALAALAALRVGLAAGIFWAPDSVTEAQLVTAGTQMAENVGRFLSMLLVLNTILCLLNLIPVPPLDGASVITGLLPPDAARRLRSLSRSGGLALVGLLAVFLLFGKLWRPVFALLLRLVHPDVLYG